MCVKQQKNIAGQQYDAWEEYCSGSAVILRMCIRQVTESVEVTGLW